MTALAAERIAPLTHFIREFSAPMIAAGVAYRGSCMSWDASDFSAAPAGTGTDTDTFPLGLSQQNVDNSAGAKGAKNVIVDLFQPVECVALANDPGAGALTMAAHGLTIVYFLDDATVTATSTNNSKAGRLWKIDSAGLCYVEMLRPAP